jgi:hypothetical protein
MRIIVRAPGNLGPFKNIVPYLQERPVAEGETPDRLRCDGVDYPFSVLGAHTISEDDSLLSTVAATIRIPVPDVVSMAQARKALILAGIGIAVVDGAIEAIEDDTERALATTDWQYATEVRRSSPLIASLAPGLGLNSAQLDQLFIIASGL